MIRLILTFLLLISVQAFSAPPSFLEENPGLKKFLFNEPKSNFYFGVGIAPFCVFKGRDNLVLNILELHYLNPLFDFEILKASVGFSIVKSTSFNGSRLFLARTSPKIRILPYLSIGPVIGYEFVSFPDVAARTVGPVFQTPLDSFSSRGLVYGVAVNQVFPWGDELTVKISESFLQETYSTETNNVGWTYLFDDPAIQSDPTPIKSSYMAMLEIALLF